MKIWDQIAGWPPAAVTVGWIAIIAAYMAMAWGTPATFSGENWSLSVGPPSIGYLLVPTVGIWYYALYRAARARSGAGAARRGPIFVGALIVYLGCMLAAAALYEQRNDPPALLLMLVSILLFGALFCFFACIWTACAALMRTEQQGAKQGHQNQLATFFLACYLPIGVWFLHKRIKSMLSREPIAAEPSS